MGWLVDRLTPYKQSQPRWHDLAVALETYWDTYHTPAVERIEHMRSVFTADNEDVEALLKEAGVQFEVAIPIVRDNLAFAYSWRAYEIHRKDRQETLEQILQRDYSGVFVRWLPLYAPKDVPYGERFLSAQDLAFSRYTRDEVYKTYRGAVQVNLSGLQLAGVTAAEFSAAVRRKLDALRPAHIVYDGEYFFQAFRAEVELWLRNGPNVLSHQGGRLLFSLRALFDDTPADEICLDYSPVNSGARHTRWLTLPGLASALAQPSQRSLAAWQQLNASASAHGGRLSERLTYPARVSWWGLFDDLAADNHPCDLLPVHSRFAATLSGHAAWAAMPLWSLDAGSVADGVYWRLEGQEGQSRDVTGNLGQWQVPASTLLLDVQAQSGARQGARSTVAVFDMAHRFDDTPADTATTDREPLSSARHGAHAHTLAPWAIPPAWRLDMGITTQDGAWPLPGVEGDAVQWVNNAGAATQKATKPVHFYLMGNKNGAKPTLNGAHWLQFVTDATAQPALTLQGRLSADQHQVRTPVPSTVTRQRTAPAAPCMDDVPADFAPLDMTYEVYA